MANNSVEITNGNTWKLKKIHIALIIILAIVSIMINAAQPIVWKTKVDIIQDIQIQKQIENEQRFREIERAIDENKELTKEMKFNLKRLMKDKFDMEYLEDTNK